MTKLERWEADFNRLSDNQREFLRIMVPEVISSDELREANSIDRTIAVGNARIYRLGLSETCARCGGTGEYSFNYRDGTRCYGCNGRKWIVRYNKRALARYAYKMTKIERYGGWEKWKNDGYPDVIDR